MSVSQPFTHSAASPQRPHSGTLVESLAHPSVPLLVLCAAAGCACLQGEPWQAVIKGHELDMLAQQQDQQRLLLERFQREVCSALSCSIGRNESRCATVGL